MADVTDHRPPARGLASKALRAWVAITAAVLIAVIIFLSGPPRPQPADETRAVEASMAAVAGVPTTPERARFAQEYLGTLPPTEPSATHVTTPAPLITPGLPPDRPRPATPLERTPEDRARREYEALFSSPVVWSKRPGARDAGRGRAPTPAPAPAAADDGDLEERVTALAIKQLGLQPDPAVPVKQDSGQPAAPTPAPVKQDAPRPAKPVAGEHRIYEGTVIDCALTNRLSGSMEGPVNCLVTNPVYAQNFTLCIPAGSRVLGRARAVQAFGEDRLAVTFHRVVLPNGNDLVLDEDPGLNQVGDVGFKDTVNHHFLSTFAAAGAIGLISGFSQWVASGGSRDGNNIVIGGVADTTSQAAMMTMNRFLNRLPTITIREGHRVKVYLTHDLDLPPYPVAP